MGYTIKVNPADLQDRDAFLAFLGRQAERGYRAARVLPTHTYFRKAPPESVSYTLAFDSGESGEPEAGGNLFGLDNGITIRPAPSASDDPGWCERVLANYGRFTFFRRSRLFGEVLQVFPALILSAACLYLLDLFGTAPSLAQFTGLLGKLLAVLGGISIFQLIRLAVQLFSWYVDALHLKEMRKAAALGQTYRTPDRLAARVRVKNGLACYCYGLVLIAELLYLIPVLYLLCR